MVDNDPIYPVLIMMLLVSYIEIKCQLTLTRIFLVKCLNKQLIIQSPKWITSHAYCCKPITSTINSEIRKFNYALGSVHERFESDILNLIQMSIFSCT